MGVELHDPIANDLKRHPADLRRLGACRAFVNRRQRGQAPRLNGVHRAALAAILESGPIPAIHRVVRWRIVDLSQWIFEEFRVVVAKQTLSRELRAMGYRKLSARPAIMRRSHARSRILKNLLPSPNSVKLVSARRTRSPAAGPSAARVRARRRTNEPPRLISSARSAPSTERVQPSSCPDATRRP